MKDLRSSSQPIGAIGAVALLALNEDAELTAAAAILSDCGFRTMLSRTYGEALRGISGGRPGVVLCDKHLPDGDWRDLIGWLANDPDPPRVIVLAGDDPMFYAEAINIGAYDVLMRPLDKEEVQRIVLNAFGAAAFSGVRTGDPSADF